MKAALSRAVMALAVHNLGNDRRAWALAMQAEFEAASEDGKALTFAAGCLMAAFRELPRHEEGRFAVASYVLGLVVIVPAAALMIASVFAGFPVSYLEHFALGGLLETGGVLTDATRSAVPSLLILVLLLAGFKLRFAWLALERDWTRLLSVGALSAAVTATLVIFSAVVFDHYAAALAQVATLTVELAAATALARWHARLSSAASQVPVHSV